MSKKKELKAELKKTRKKERKILDQLDKMKSNETRIGFIHYD